MGKDRDAKANGFEADFRALTDRRPYDWQRRLYEEFLTGRLPDALDLPTGLGKTSVIALWLLALAAGAPLPRRLVYGVDRRAVVDQATAEAEQLADRLAAVEGAQTSLRERLGLKSDESLPVSTLRGQWVDNRAWLQRPEGVAIIVGTVDMIGSRLLFSGYGVSRRMRPVHAALLGVDALIVLDEAHLVPPFEALLASAAELGARFQKRAPLPVPPFKVLALSATGRPSEASRFTLTDADRGDAAVAARLGAVKRLELHPPVAVEALAETLAAAARQRAAADAAVVVFCNSRKIAQAVASALNSAFAKGDAAVRRVELLVGERRVHERAALAQSPIFARFAPQRHSDAAAAGASSGPAFLVATSAGEVGVDLDADHMVCDLVFWDRMVQRLGRVNRRPKPGEAWVDVFPCLQKPDKEAEDSVTDVARLAAPFETAVWPRDAQGRLNASPGTLLSLRAVPEFAALAARATSDAPLYPALTRPHLEAWAMTSLPQHAGRTLVAPWLRGWVEAAEPECRVAWRTHLPVRLAPGPAAGALEVDGDFLLACLPHLSETLDAPAWRVAEVLKSRAKSTRATAADAGTPPVCVVLLEADGSGASALSPQFLKDRDAQKLAAQLAQRIVILDARLGGLDEAGLLDPKFDAPPRTLDDGDDWLPTLDAIGFRIRKAPEGLETDAAWRVQARWSASEDAAEPDLVVEVRRRLGSDQGDLALARWAQRLAEHQTWAGRHAKLIGEAVRLPPDVARMLCFAAEAHDEGKRRAEWQRALGMAPDGGPAWAKNGKRRGVDKLADGRTDGRANPALMAAYRHEFGSVHDAAARIETVPPAWRDLFFHLIAAHHGYARPSILAHDPARPPGEAAALAQEIALRFERLQAHWGPWGLAWWESMLKAADWHASAELNDSEQGEVPHG